MKFKGGSFPGQPGQGYAAPGSSEGSNGTKTCTGSSYMSESVVGGSNTQHAAPECDPLHGRHYRQHLEGETATEVQSGGILAIGLAQNLI